MSVDYQKQMMSELQSIKSMEDFCREWSKIKAILIVIRSILAFLFPPGAAVIDIIIDFFDKQCPSPKVVSAKQGKKLQRRTGVR